MGSDTLEVRALCCDRRLPEQILMGVDVSYKSSSCRMYKDNDAISTAKEST